MAPYTHRGDQLSMARMRQRRQGVIPRPSSYKKQFTPPPGYTASGVTDPYALAPGKVGPHSAYDPDAERREEMIRRHEAQEAYNRNVAGIRRRALTDFHGGLSERQSRSLGQMGVDRRPQSVIAQTNSALAGDSIRQTQPIDPAGPYSRGGNRFAALQPPVAQSGPQYPVPGSEGAAAFPAMAGQPQMGIPGGGTPTQAPGLPPGKDNGDGTYTTASGMVLDITGAIPTPMNRYSIWADDSLSTDEKQRLHQQRLSDYHAATGRPVAYVKPHISLPMDEESKAKRREAAIARQNERRAASMPGIPSLVTDPNGPYGNNPEAMQAAIRNRQRHFGYYGVPGQSETMVNASKPYVPPATTIGEDGNPAPVSREDWFASLIGGNRNLETGEYDTESILAAINDPTSPYNFDDARMELARLKEEVDGPMSNAYWAMRVRMSGEAAETYRQIQERIKVLEQAVGGGGEEAQSAPEETQPSVSGVVARMPLEAARGVADVASLMNPFGQWGGPSAAVPEREPWTRNPIAEALNEPIPEPLVSEGDIPPEVLAYLRGAPVPPPGKQQERLVRRTRR